MDVGGCGTFKCTEKLEGGGRYDLNGRSHQFINAHPPHMFPAERSLNYRH